MTPILELRGITDISGVVANDHIDFHLNQGEIWRCSARTAGKTTLMNILYGLYTPDEGEIIIKGERAAIVSPTVPSAGHRHGAPALYARAPAR